MVDSGALRFGDFVLKSGRRSPFFMNAGCYVTGSQLRTLGNAYARAIHDNFGLEFDVLFGPAYKGIPLAVATAMALSELYGKEVRYCSNRKEAKDHGDGGILLGGAPRDGDRIVMIEDVTTSGQSIAETWPILMAQAQVSVIGLVVSLNRMERGVRTSRGALEEIREKYGIATASIVDMADVIDYLYMRPWKGEILIDEERKASLDAYYAEYGAENQGTGPSAGNSRSADSRPWR